MPPRSCGRVLQGVVAPTGGKLRALGEGLRQRQCVHEWASQSCSSQGLSAPYTAGSAFGWRTKASIQMIPPSSDVRKPKANTFNIVQQTRSWRAKPACEDSAARTAGAAGAARGADHVRAGARGLSAARSDEDWGAVGRRASARQDGVPNRIRTGVTAVKGRCPRPLDDGDLEDSYDGRRPVWWR